MRVVIIDVVNNKRFVFTSEKQFKNFLGFITEELYDLFYNLHFTGRYIIIKEKK